MPPPRCIRSIRLTLPGCPGGQRLDQALALVLPQYSRSRLAAWIKDGAVALDGAAAERPRDAVFGGEQVVVRAARRRRTRASRPSACRWWCATATLTYS